MPADPASDRHCAPAGGGAAEAGRRGDDPPRRSPSEGAEPPGPTPQQEVQALGARVLSRFVLLVAMLVLLSAGLELAWTANAGRVPLRLALGLLMLAGGGVAWWLRRRGRDRQASVAALLVLAAAAALQAFASGLGLHSLALGGVSLLVAMAGVLLTLRAALALALFNVASVMLMLAAHRLGWMAPVDVVLRMEPEARLIGHLVLTAAGLVAALTLSRPLQRSLQRALTQERRLSQLLRLGSDWAWELDTGGRLTMLTPSFEHHTGRRVDEFMRLGLPGGPSIVDDGDWTDVRAALASRLPFRERVVSYRCTDGTLLVVKASGEPMRDDGGHFIGWWGVSRNVTAEVQAQRELQRSREMLERLFRESPDAIFVAPIESGRLMMFNEAFVQLSGFPPGELQGRSGLELGLWRDTTQALQLRQLLQRGGRVRDWRSVCWTRSGDRRELLITAGRFEWDGEPVAVFTARDITDVERDRAEGEAILNSASVGVALVRDQAFDRINLPSSACTAARSARCAARRCRRCSPSRPTSNAFSPWPTPPCRAARRWTWSAMRSARTARACWCGCAAWRSTPSAHARVAPSGSRRTSPSRAGWRRCWPRPATRPRPPARPRVPSWPA